MEGWDGFLIAEAGASAALAGLIFVGVSLNLTRILAFPNLPPRAFQALLLLLSILVITSLMLVPGVPARLVGIELLITGGVVWLASLWMDISIHRRTAPEYRNSFIVWMVLGQIATLPYALAGLLVLLNGPAGFYWIVPAVLVSFIKAVMDAWVLLVEINR